MHFRTQIPISKSDNQIDYNSRVVSLGSCFAVNIANKFDYYKFQNIVNPFGILFHPLAINKMVQKAVNQEKFTEAAIFFHNERWHSFDVHSDLSNTDKDAFLDNLNKQATLLHDSLLACSHLIITYGTSWVYREKENFETVANCHKVPQNHFDKEILSVDSIENAISQTIDAVKKINPNCHFIFTVSPVRHIKDGFVENQRSKAHLITAIQNQLGLGLPNTSYFPSYEIMMDELRDYRFYAEDMLHPNQTAIDYIWQRFKETSISETAIPTLLEIENIQKGLTHRPFNPESESHQQFLSKLQTKISRLQNQFPHLHF